MNDDAAMTAVEIVLASLTKWRQLRQSKRSLGRRTPPLFVGLQGPQGSGEAPSVSQQKLDSRNDRLIVGEKRQELHSSSSERDLDPWPS